MLVDEQKRYGTQHFFFGDETNVVNEIDELADVVFRGRADGKASAIVSAVSVLTKVAPSRIDSKPGLFLLARR